MIEAFARIPVEVEYASELRYRNPPMTPGTLLFAITQSGETIDTLAALREMKRKGHPDAGDLQRGGQHDCPRGGRRRLPARRAGNRRRFDQGVHVAVRGDGPARALLRPDAAPELRGRAADHRRACGTAASMSRKRSNTNNEARRIAAKYASCDNFLYLGRQYNFPTALEGALKLKEISYIHAEGYPAAEMKHGPIALVDEHTPSVFIVPQGGVYHKVISNMEEIKARGGPVIAIVDKDDSHAVELADDVIRVPAVPEFLQPIVTADPAATAGLPRGHPPRLRRRQAAESGEERDGGVNQGRELSVKSREPGCDNAYA